MPTITLTVQNRIASVGAGSIVNGNSDYTLTITADAEWSAYENVKCVLIKHTLDGDSAAELTPTGGTVALPVLQNTVAVSVGLAATDGENAIASTMAPIPCIECITDGYPTEGVEPYDVYDHMMEYIAGVQRGIHTPAELEAMYAELLEHMTPPEPGEFPSDEYRAAIAAPQRVSRIAGTITFLDETEAELTDNEVVSGTLGICTDCMTDDVLLPGGVPSAELTVTLRGQEDPATLYGAEIAPVFQLLLPSGVWYDVPLGVFTVDSVETTTEQYAEITAYDDMQKLSSTAFSALNLTAGQAYSAEELIELCADAVDLETEYVGALLNTSKSYFAANIGERAETARDVLMFAVQTLNAFAYVDRFRKLIIKAVASADPTATVTASQRKTLTTSSQYRLFAMTTTYTYTDDTGNDIVTHYSDTGYWPSGVTAELMENPLWGEMDEETRYKPGEIAQALRAILVALDPVVFTPLTAETFDDPAAELMEWRTFTRGEESFTAPITSIEWHYHSSQTLTACGADAVAGMLKSQAEKQALAVRLNAAAAEVNFWRELYLGIIQTTGHQALVYHTHEWIGHFTQGELSGEDLS